MRRPAPARSIMEKATSVAMRAPRARRLEPTPPAVERMRWASVTPAPLNAGRNPANSEVPIARVAAKPTTRASTPTRSWNPAGRASPTRPRRRSTLMKVIARPAAPPRTPRTAVSVSRSRWIRGRLAPSAVRSAISPVRRSLESTNRFATFAHATRSTSATAAINMSDCRPASPMR
jgi:hypothetical protein